jgi:DNA-binding beta-propeller fold protein YncE
MIRTLRSRVILSFLLCCTLFSTGPQARAQGPVARRLLYVAEPGIRNYLEFGGAGILVFDIERDHAFVKRIPTPASQQAKPENIKGICACAATQKLYFTTLTRLYCLDLATEKVIWDKAPPGGCDRLAITPDGKTLYVPTLEKDHWNVVDGASGDLITRIETKSRTHNTCVSLDGTRMYLAGIGSPYLSVADSKSHKVIQKTGPFGAGIRPFTINADQSLCFVNVNGLLGFEVGDLRTGQMLHRVEVAGVKTGPVKRHGCPSHGIGLTPDEKEIWVCDGHNSQMHVFDATVMPPKQIASIKLREQPGWVTFSVDGRFAYASTGEVIDPKTKKIVASLRDEEGRAVHSEKVLEMIFAGDRLIGAGDQFGVGRAGRK